MEPHPDLLTVPVTITRRDIESQSPEQLEDLLKCVAYNVKDTIKYEARRRGWLKEK
jgi:hypothetical protein